METVEIIIEETVTPITIEVYDGVPGDSAYVVAVKNGFEGTEAEWLESLKGADGTGGGVWGSITGTLANQTDLVTALDAKVDEVAGYTLTKNDFTDILKAKLDSITEIFTTALKTAYDGAVTWISTNGSNLISHLSNSSNPHSVTATQTDALKRDGSNANSDVDLGIYALNAKSIKVNGTAGNGNVGLKHQSSGSTASGSESVIYADLNGNPKWKNDGNTVQSIMLDTNSIKLLHRSNSPSSTISSSTANTILANIPLVGGTLSTEDNIYLDSLTLTKTGSGGTTNIRIYISPNNNSLTGATQIGALFMTATLIYAKMRRKFDIYGGNLYFSSIANITTVDDITTSSTAVISSIAYNVSNTYYLIITGQLASSADTLNISGIRITN